MVVLLRNPVNSATSISNVTRPLPFAGNFSANCFACSITRMSNGTSSPLRRSLIFAALIISSYKIFDSYSPMLFPFRTLLLCLSPDLAFAQTKSMSSTLCRLRFCRLSPLLCPRPGFSIPHSPFHLAVSFPIGTGLPHISTPGSSLLRPSSLDC